MPERFKPFPPLSGRYGAPLGRHSWQHLDTGGRLYLRRVYLNSGGYDAGGAYWGLGVPLWLAMDQQGETRYLRARSRDAAKAMILDDAPDARFYR